MGLFEGTDCGTQLFCPDDPLPRWAIAVWLVRILDTGDPSPRSSRFADVADNPWWEPHVERLAELGVTLGCGINPLRYCPNGNVSRADMASFLTRAFALPAGPDAGFTDVDAMNAHYDNINALFASGVTAGCGTNPLRYCADRATSRAEMATFLWRAASRPALSYGTLDRAAILAVRPSLSKADHADALSSYELGNIQRDSDALQLHGEWEQGHGFYYTNRSSSYAYWHFGWLRGEYRAEVFHPERHAVKACSLADRLRNRCPKRPPTASPRYKIWQYDGKTWTTIYDFESSIRDNSGQYKERWWGWNDVKLDGYIVVEVRKRYSDNHYRLAAASFRFLWRDLLPADKRVAIASCQSTSLHEVLEQQKVISYVNFAKETLKTLAEVIIGVGVQILLPAIPTGVATVIRGIKAIKDTAGLIRAAKAISDAIRAVQNAVPEALKAAETLLKVLKDTIQLTDDLVDAGVLDSDAKRLYDAYKRYCQHPNDTLVGDDNGWPIGGSNGVGNGCDIRRYTCVPGYLEFVPNWHD